MILLNLKVDQTLSTCFPSHLEKMLRFLYWPPIPTWSGYHYVSDFRNSLASVHFCQIGQTDLLFLKHAGRKRQ